MNCQAAETFLNEQRNGALSDQDQVELHKHLDMCEDCRIHAEIMSVLRLNVAELPKAEPDDFYEDRLLDAVIQVAERHERRRWHGWAAVAACAALVGALGMTFANSKATTDQEKQIALEATIRQEQDLIMTNASDPLAGGTAVMPVTYGQ